MQKVGFEIMKAVAGICDAHELKYVLYCGTLLGAIRHGGFIPWDDDIDLAMPLKDYKRFLRIAPKELPKGYVLQTMDTTRSYRLLFAKVCADGTTALHPRFAAMDRHWGISIDIYPFVGAADGPEAFKKQVHDLRAARALKSVDQFRCTPKSELSFVQRVTCYIPYGVRKALSDRYLRSALIDPSTTKKMCTLDAAPFEPKFDSHLFDEVVRHEFEDETFWIPARYDEALRIMYGDYMTPPPEGQRGGHENDFGGLILDPHRDYREYLREIL